MTSQLMMVEPLVVAVTPLRLRVSIWPSATEVSSPPSSICEPLYWVEETVRVSEPAPPCTPPRLEEPLHSMVSLPLPPSMIPATVAVPVTVSVSLPSPPITLPLTVPACTEMTSSPRPPSTLPPMLPVVLMVMVSPESSAALMSIPLPPPSTSPVTEALPRILMVSAPPAPSTLPTTAESCTRMVSGVRQPRASVPLLEPPVVVEPSTQVLRRYQSLGSIEARLVNQEGIPPLRP